MSSTRLLRTANCSENVLQGEGREEGGAGEGGRATVGVGKCGIFASSGIGYSSDEMIPAACWHFAIPYRSVN